jgi:hypothetical protein
MRTLESRALEQHKCVEACFTFQIVLSLTHLPCFLPLVHQVYDAITGGADEIDLNGRSINSRAYCGWVCAANVSFL